MFGLVTNIKEANFGNGSGKVSKKIKSTSLH